MQKPCSVMLALINDLLCAPAPAALAASAATAAFAAAELALLRGREAPWLVAERRGHALELGQPSLDVLSLGVIVLGLLNGVKLVDTPAGDARSSRPVAPVARRVIAHQRGLEILGAQTPVEAKRERKVGCDVLAAAIGHEARRRKLAHVSIDQRHARLAVHPTLEGLEVLAPCHVLVRWARQHEDTRAVLLGVPAEPVAYQQLEADPVGGLVGHACGLVLDKLGVDVPRRKAPGA